MGYEWRFDLVFRWWPFLASGVKLTLLLASISMVVGAVIGLAAAIIRMSKIRAFDLVVTLYVDAFRTVPPLALLFWLLYVIPIVTGIDVSPVASAVVGIGLISGANFCEVVRGGILSIPRGQWEAAMALGMTTRQVYQRVILPQALTRMIPPTTSQFISLLKATSLASAIGVAELQFQAQTLSEWNYHPIENLTVAGVIYFTLAYPVAYITNRLYERWLPQE